MTLEALAKAFKQFVTDQSTINQVLSNHTHVNGPLGVTFPPIPPDQFMLWYMGFKVDAMTTWNMTVFEAKLGTFIGNYTKPGDKYILSSNVFCD